MQRDRTRRPSLAARASFAGLALWLACVPRPAAAEDPLQPGLNWVRLPGAESCLSASALATRVETRVGRMLFVSVSDAGLSVDGSVRALPAGWQVTLDISDPDGRILGRRELQFEGADCSVIDDSVALVIAITLYPDTGLIDGGIPLDAQTAAKLEALFGSEPIDPDPASLPGSGTPATSSSRPVRPAARPAQRGGGPRIRREPWTLGLALAATGALGHLPGLAGGGSGYVLVTPPDAWPMQLGLLWLPGTLEAADEGQGEARFDVLTGSLALCPWQPSWLESLAFCAGVEAGRLHVEPRRFASGNRALTDAVASLLGLALLQPRLLGPLHLRVALALSVPLIQRAYTFRSGDGTPSPLFRMPQLAGRLELGLGVFF